MDVFSFVKIGKLSGDNELRPQLGDSGAFLETPARMGGQSASGNAKAATGAGAGWRWLRALLVFGGGGRGAGIGHLRERGAKFRGASSAQRLAGPRRREGSRPAPPLRSRGTSGTPAPPGALFLEKWRNRRHSHRL
ncbi:unnamed protein product [Coccothraustes coccothraustes]